MESFIFIISTPDRDRHGTAVNVNGWNLENYRSNPIVHWCEPMPFIEDDPDEVIGTSIVWIENRKLYGEWKPDPSSEIAMKIQKKLKGGTSLGASVNLLPIRGFFGKGDEAEGGKNETYYYARQELLSWKIVPLPSNPNCVYQKDYRGDRGAKAREIERKVKIMEMKLKHGV